MGLRTHTCLLLALAAAAAALTAETFSVPRTPPQTLEQLAAGNVPGAARVTSFVQREPRDSMPATESTTAFVSHDDANLYVGFICGVAGAKARAHLAKREDIADDDRVTVYLDTMHDGRRAYLFSMNAFGVQRDGMMTDGQSTDFNFDTLWSSQARLTRSGYLALFAIPFKSLRFRGARLQSWGIALGRSIVQNNENAFWPPITLRQQSFVRQFTEATVADVDAGRHVELAPYAYARDTGLLDYGAGQLAPRRDFRAGMDVKAVLHDTLTLDATINPDFSQVESDDPQVTVNQRYEVYFPEKRPFFLENAGYFSTPINLFFSRRIMDPSVGARMTGKLGHWNLGFLGADDRAPGASAATSRQYRGLRTGIGVVRVQRDLGSQSTVGFLATDREFAGSRNRVVSADTRVRLSDSWTLTGQLARSFDVQLNGTRRSGSATRLDLLRAGRNFTYSATYNDISPYFRAPLGFVRRTDVRQVSQYAGYLFRPDGGRVLSFGPSISTGMNWDHNGVLQDWYGNLEFGVDMAGPAGIKVSRYEAFERYLGQGLRYHRDGASFYVGNARAFTFYGSAGHGTGVNYQPVYPAPVFVAGSTDASIGVNVRPRPRVRIDGIYYYTRLGAATDARRNAEITRGSPVYSNHMWRTKVNYQFTRALSLRGIVDYYGVLPNSYLIQQERYKQLSADVLLTYLVRPGTALYIGYTTQRENYSWDSDHGMLVRNGGPAFVTGKQIFVKLNYTLRF